MDDGWRLSRKLNKMLGDNPNEIAADVRADIGLADCRITNKCALTERLLKFMLFSISFYRRKNVAGHFGLLRRDVRKGD